MGSSFRVCNFLPFVHSFPEFNHLECAQHILVTLEPVPGEWRDSIVYMYMVLEFLPHLFGEEVEVPTMQSGQQPSHEAVLKELD